MLTRSCGLHAAILLALAGGTQLAAQTRAVYSVGTAETVARQTGRPILAIAGTKG